MSNVTDYRRNNMLNEEQIQGEKKMATSFYKQTNSGSVDASNRARFDPENGD